MQGYISDMKTANRTTLSDISSTAGVSLSTVYRILRGKRRRGNTAHEQVVSLLEKHGFLDKRISPLLLVESVSRSRHGHMLAKYFHDACRRERIQLYFSRKEYCAEDIQKYKPAGIVSLTELDFSPDIPLVYLNCHINIPGVDSVCQDGQQNLVNLLCSLKEAGYKRIGCFLPGTGSIRYNYAHGFVLPENAYVSAGLQALPELFFRLDTRPENHYENCLKAADYFYRLSSPPDVIALTNDGYMYAIAGFLNMRKSPIRLASADNSVYGSAETLNFPQSQLAALGNLPCCEMADAALALVCDKIKDHSGLSRKILFSSKINLCNPYNS